jgi:hypothetical protein
MAAIAFTARRKHLASGETPFSFLLVQPVSQIGTEDEDSLSAESHHWQMLLFDVPVDRSATAMQNLHQIVSRVELCGVDSHIRPTGCELFLDLRLAFAGRLMSP